MFTLQGKERKALEEEHNIIEEGIFKKIMLEPKLKKDMENFLKISGVTDYTIFPDLDGLAKQINKLNFSSRMVEVGS